MTFVVIDKQRFAYLSLFAPKAPRRSRSGQESGRVFGPYEVTDAASSSVTGTSTSNLPKMAVGQIVPGIIEVYMVGNVGEAAVEHQLESLVELESLAKP